MYSGSDLNVFPTSDLPTCSVAFSFSALPGISGNPAAFLPSDFLGLKTLVIPSLKTLCWLPSHSESKANSLPADPGPCSL